MLNNYTIKDFWKPQIPVQKPNEFTPLSGWEFDVSPFSSFVEAPLTLSNNFTDNKHPNVTPIILVSAAGAVGKSTLARQIASQTKAVFLDLAKADPVGGYTLSGGLVRAGIFNDWNAGSTALLIDGLDEARLKVTQESFVAFIKDVAALCASRSIPTVLFGRTGAVEDAWLILATEASTIPVSVLEIGYYPPELAEHFAFARYDEDKPDCSYREAAHQAISGLLTALRQDTINDGDRFSGYAPVLQAVARRVAQEKNPSNLISQLSRGEQPVTLRTIVTAILEREQSKLKTIAFEDTNLRQILYRPEEQMKRLVARVYAHAPPPMPEMSANDAQAYSNALDTWVPDHPFLDGSITPASAVFSAVITAAALRDAATTACRQLSRIMIEANCTAARKVDFSLS